MRVISKKRLRDFWELHQDCEEQLKAWFNEAEQGVWNSPNDLRHVYPSVSILKANRAVFNIKGNSYRLIVRINYSYGIVWIRFIGTHDDYNNVNAEII
jgi:mRNA interferase HigB